MRVLAVNSGSSSLKLRVVESATGRLAHSADLPPLSGEALAAAVAETLAPWDDLEAVGHRVVHGGRRFTAPERITPTVRSELAELCELAPLHQRRSIEAIDAVSLVLTRLPAVACFDTAFHAGLPAAAATFAIPLALSRQYGLRRYGFHGLSHAYVAHRAAQLLERDGLRIVSCHLGAGASLAAIAAGRSVDTTMGFTPLDGLVMATRSGSLDPGLLIWLETHGGLAPEELGRLLEHESGLLGLAGSADMSRVQQRAAAGDSAASLALDVYLHRLRGMVAAMAASLCGVDALVFTGGVGENSPEVRRRTVAGLGFLGLVLDETSNVSAEGDALVSAPESPARVLVLRAREDLEIAHQVAAVLGAPRGERAPRRAVESIGPSPSGTLPVE